QPARVVDVVLARGEVAERDVGLADLGVDLAVRRDEDRARAALRGLGLGPLPHRRVRERHVVERARDLGVVRTVRLFLERERTQLVRDRAIGLLAQQIRLADALDRDRELDLRDRIARRGGLEDRDRALELLDRVGGL